MQQLTRLRTTSNVKRRGHRLNRPASLDATPYLDVVRMNRRVTGAAENQVVRHLKAAKEALIGYSRRSFTETRSDSFLRSPSYKAQLWCGPGASAAGGRSWRPAR